MALSPFHLAIPVYDLAAARHFYGDVFGLAEGRSSDHWVDFDAVDGHNVPVPHFGIVLGWDEWEALADRLRARETQFVIEPYIRFQGQVGEQATMFLFDPCGNALEFKAFKDMSQLFAK